MACQLCILVILEFFSGFAWAVQRPQGFFIVLLEQHGFSGPALGLLSGVGLLTPTIFGPCCGWVADHLAEKHRHRLYAALMLMKSLLQSAAWPALQYAPHAGAYWWILACTCLQAACSTGGMLTEIVLRCVGKETYGKVRLWGGIGFATGSLVTGLLSRTALGYSVLFLESFFVSSALSLTSFGLASPEQLLETRPSSKPSARELWQVVRRPRVAMTLLIVVALGLCEGIMQSYTYVRLQLLPHGSSTVMGLSAVCMIISEVPFFYFADPIVRRFGILPILSFALLCAALRQAWISVLWDALWVLPGELLHGITFSIANAAVTLSVHDLAPRLETTLQSLIGSCWVGLGQGAASCLGGWLLVRLGAAELFTVSALLALVAAQLPLTMALWDKKCGRG